jgi:Bacterial Ig domain
MKRIILFFLVVFSFTISCKKQDTVAPEVEIILPTSNQVFSVGDTVFISAKVSDNEIIKQIQVAIVNENRIPVLSNIVVQANTNPYSFQMSYPIDNIYLEDGKYYVLVKAMDEENFKNKYCEIYINEIPKELKKVILVARSGVDIAVCSVDTAFQSIAWTPMYTDYAASVVDSRTQQLIIAGNITDDIVAYDISSQTTNWTIDAVPNPPFQFCTNMNIQNQEVMLSLYYNRQFKTYNTSGNLTKSATIDIPNFYPVYAYKTDDYYFLFIKGISGGNAIELYYPASLVSHNALFVGYGILEMFEYDNDNIFCFGNTSAGQGVMEIYEISSNNTWEPHTVPIGKIFNVAETDKGEFLIAHSDGVYRYTYYNNSLVNILSVNPRQIEYDEVNDLFYVVDNIGKLTSYTNTSPPTQINQVLCTDTVLDMHLLYNK